MTDNTYAQAHRDHVKTFMLLLVLAYLLVYILPNGLRPLSIPDETRYAEMPREMISSGDWIVPRLIDLRYFEKPVLGYWLNAISISIFGENNFAVRLPSALSMGISAWFIWLLLVRTGYERRTALAGAAVFLTLFEVLMIGSIAILDSPFSMFLTAGMVLFYLSTECADNKVRQRRYLAGSGVMYGLAFLTKGFLAFALPGIILLPFILITKKYNLIWRSSWVILFVIITIAPWSIAIHLREPDYWHYFVWEEHVRRFLSPNAQHAAPFYYYFISLPIAAFPWIGFLPAAVAGHFKKSQNISLNWYLILWLCLPLLFFSISSGKLISYILPCMAPLAVLVTIGTINYLKSGNQRWFVFGSIISTATLAILLYLLLHNELSASGTPYFNEKEQLKFIVLAGGLLIACILMFLSVFFTAIHSRLILVLCGAGMILPLVNISVPNSVLGNKSPSFIINHVLNKTKDNAILVSDANVVRSVAWVFKRSDIYLLSTGEFGYGLSYPEHADKLLGVAGLKTLIEKQKRGEISNDIAVFCEEPCTQSLKTLLGHHADQMSNDEFSAWYIQAK